MEPSNSTSALHCYFLPPPITLIHFFCFLFSHWRCCPSTRLYSGTIAAFSSSTWLRMLAMPDALAENALLQLNIWMRARNAERVRLIALRKRKRANVMQIKAFIQTEILIDLGGIYDAMWKEQQQHQLKWMLDLPQPIPPASTAAFYFFGRKRHMMHAI